MEGLDRIVAAHDRVVGEAGAQETAQNFSSCECCCECCCEKCCESLGATSSSSRKKGATRMRNEEPTRTDPPPGSTGDLAAGFGAALSRESELAEGFADARLVLLAAQGHVELRRLYGRPC